MKVLVACEYSGVVRRAFRAKGHNAWSCDIIPCDDKSPHHIMGDVTLQLDNYWDLMIAHPPCTYMTNSGVCWLHKDPSRWAKLDEAAKFFLALYDAPIPLKCIENPIMHGYAKDRIRGIRQTQVIQPWMFGHMEQKATCLWLQGLPPLKPTNNVKAEMMKLPNSERQKLHWLPPSKDRWKLRSTTFQGFADAMADQWSNIQTTKSNDRKAIRKTSQLNLW